MWYWELGLGLGLWDWDVGLGLGLERSSAVRGGGEQLSFGPSSPPAADAGGVPWRRFRVPSSLLMSSGVELVNVFWFSALISGLEIVQRYLFSLSQDSQCFVKVGAKSCEDLLGLQYRPTSRGDLPKHHL